MSQHAEATYSATVKVNGDLFTVRGGTVEEFLENLMNAQTAVSWIEALQGIGVAQSPQPASQAPQNAAVPQQQAPQSAPTGGIETMQDKWGNSFQRGVPGTGYCAHGARVVKNGTSKAGKAYKMYACINDTPFGNASAGKCEGEWPAR